MQSSMIKHFVLDNPDRERPSQKEEVLEKAVALAKSAGFVFIATSDAGGVPHMAAAAGLEKAGPESVSVLEWFCPGTVKNLRQNEQVSLVVWDRNDDSGYQLVGRLEGFKDVNVLNGYRPAVNARPRFPQLERQLLIRVKTICDFSAAPHSDAEEASAS